MTTYTAKIIESQTTGNGTQEEKTVYVRAADATITLDVHPPVMGTPVEIFPEGENPYAITAAAHGPKQHLPSGDYTTRLSDLREYSPSGFDRLVERFRAGGWHVEPSSPYHR